MAGYTRQSSFTDGDVITAAHSNDEFNQILAAFVNTSGHKHDGTASEGPVIGLIGDPGIATPLNKVVVSNTDNRVGVFVDAGGAGSSVEQVRFQDGVIVPVTNNDIDLGTSSLQFKDAFFDGTITTDTIVVASTIGHDDDTDLLTLADGILTVAGEVSMTTLDIGGTNVTSTGAELNLIDGSGAGTIVNSKAVIYGSSGEVNATTLQIGGSSITSTAAELNLMDGGTSAGTTAVAGGDGIVTNDAGTMRQTTVDTFDTYLSQTTKTLTNKTLTTPTITTPIVNAGAQLKNGATSAGFLEFFEDSDNGTNKLTLIGPASTADVTLTLPSATDTLVGKDTTDTLTNKTLTSAVLNGTISGTSIKDEDNMASDSANHLATQQSIKAFVESQVSSVSASSTTTFTNKSLTAPIITGSSSAAGSILFKEDTDNGTNAVTLIGPASTADVTVTLPASAGTVALTSDIPSAGISSGNVATFTSGAADNDFLRIDGTAIEGRSASEVLSDIGGQASLTFGISNTNAVKVDSSSVADDEFARFTANGLESRSTSEVLSDIGAITASSSDTLTNKSIDSDNNTITNIVNADIKAGAAIVDTKLATISTANKVALTAVDIDGADDIGAALTSSDLIVVDDGAGGTNRKAALSRLTTFFTAQGFSSEDPTALAIALG